MSTCKECRWFSRCGRSGVCSFDKRQYVKIGPELFSWEYPVQDIDDPACSHFSRSAESPGNVTFVRYAGDGRVAIDPNYYSNQKLLESLAAQMGRGKSKTFRLEPVEDGS